MLKNQKKTTLCYIAGLFRNLGITFLNMVIIVFAHALGSNGVIKKLRQRRKRNNSRRLEHLYRSDINADTIANLYQN